MKKSILLLIATLFIGGLYAQQLDYPTILRWLDDDNYLQAMKDKNGENAVFKVNAKTGKAKKFTDKNFRDEVMGNLPEAYKNVRIREFTKDYNSSTFVKNGNLFYYYRPNNIFKQLTDNASEEKTPIFSPNEKFIAYTRDHDLYYIDVETGLEHRLTNDGTELIKNGYASWVYMEEIIGRRSQYKAFWWSPDSKKLAFLKFDDTAVPEFFVYDADGIHGEWEKALYPKVGDTNPGVKFGILHLDTKKVIWLDSNAEEDKYVAFPNWMANSDKVFYQTNNRKQNNLKIYLADVNTGDKKEVYNEAQDSYIEFYNDLYPFTDGSGFILRSDKDGWRNLYHYDFNGKLINKITNLDWRVNSIAQVDEENKMLYFTGTGENSTESHLFSINLDGTGMKKLTADAGSHRPILSPNGNYFIDNYSNIEKPLRAELFSTKGNHIRFLGSRSGLREGKLTGKVELFSIPNPDGFDMPAWWILPANFDPTKKYGVVFQIYGGPDSKNVNNRWMNPQGHYMTENSIIRFSVDHRGSGHFGKKGLSEFYGNLGKYDIQDYIEAVKWLLKQGFVDETKIGITGGSYGGYMTALALTKGSDYFTHGFASYAVTDWRLYDNVYTERYMGTLKGNAEGYENGNINNFADRLKGKLWIIHGTMDDNVHMQHVIQFIDALQEAGKDFNFMMYPKGRHGWGGKKRIHSTRLQREFWLKEFGQN